jgi:hypothetical protein
MNLSHIGLTLSLAFGISGAALAQSPIQFVSSTAKAGPPVRQACLAEAKVFQTKLALHPRREGKDHMPQRKNDDSDANFVSVAMHISPHPADK